MGHSSDRLSGRDRIRAMPDRPQPSGETERYRTLLEIRTTPSFRTSPARYSSTRSPERCAGWCPSSAPPSSYTTRTGTCWSFFILESSLGSSYFTVGFEMAPGESHVGQVFKSQQPLLKRDLATERQYPADDMAYGDGVRSYVDRAAGGARGSSIGTLAVASTTPVGSTPRPTSIPAGGGRPGRPRHREHAGLRRDRRAQGPARARERVPSRRDPLRAQLRRDGRVSPAAPRGASQDRAGGAPTDSTVLVTGETGTGKELVARAIHSRSARARRPSSRSTARAIPSGSSRASCSVTSKGAFTGAIERQRWAASSSPTAARSSSTRSASSPPELQAKLLRVLQEREFEPRRRHADASRWTCASIAATNRDLEERGPRRALPRGPLLPAERLPARGAAAARARATTSRCSSAHFVGARSRSGSARRIETISPGDDGAARAATRGRETCASCRTSSSARSCSRGDRRWSWARDLLPRPGPPRPPAGRAPPRSRGRACRQVRRFGARRRPGGDRAGSHRGRARAGRRGHRRTQGAPRRSSRCIPTPCAAGWRSSGSGARPPAVS